MNKQVQAMNEEFDSKIDSYLEMIQLQPEYKQETVEDLLSVLINIRDLNDLKQFLYEFVDTAPVQLKNYIETALKNWEGTPGPINHPKLLELIKKWR